MIQATVATPTPARASVLVVDDVKANLLALDALLSELGCDVVLADSGNEALRQLLRREFAVMLLDVQMPHMDGFEVAMHARQNPSTRDLPIIFLTATHEGEHSILRGYGSGAVDFLLKPIDTPILCWKVRVFLDLWTSRKQILDAKSELERKNADLRRLADEKAALAARFQCANAELATAYRELQTTQAQLVQSAKLASLGELVAGVAHEINNPLAFAQSHLETAKRCLDATEAEAVAGLSASGKEQWRRARNRLQEMGLGLERIRELVLKLRTFSRLDEGERKLVSVRESIESVLTIMGHRVKDCVRIETHFGAQDSLDCFPALLNQAVLNLVANAIDAVEEEGTVTISTRGAGADYEIAVADTGPGIPAHLRERVLEPFFTTKEAGQGTGLGLSITDSIVRKHGGRLEFGDAPGGGTVATIRIPATSAEAGT